MSKSKRDTTVGIAAGFAAVATLLICAFPVHMALLPSFGVAVLVGAAALLVAPGGPLGPRTKPSESEAKAIAGSKVKIESLRKMAAGLPSARAKGRDLLVRIAAEAEKILGAVETDANKFEAAEPFLAQYLTPMESWTKRYVLLADRDVAAAVDFLDKAERNVLPKMLASLVTLFEKLHVSDIAQLLAGNDAELNFPDIELAPEESK